MSQKVCRRTKGIVIIALFLAIFISQVITIRAANDFEEILQPLTTIYNLVKYAATIIAGLVMVFAGVSYIMGGSDPQKREKAKSMVMYVIIGLMVIWAAPFVVNLILGD